MARSSLRLLPLLAGAVLLAACGNSAAPTGGAMASIPLASATLSPYAATYKISGPVTGTETVDVAAANGKGMQVTQDATIGEVKEHEVFTLAARGLAVHAATEAISAPGVKVAIAAKPSGQAMQENATVNGRIEAPTIPLQKPYQVNGVLLTALSGLTLRPGETATIEDVILQHATSVPLALTVGKETTLATPIGTEPCYPVTLSAAGKLQTAWYEAKAPHALLRYVNGQVVFEIASLTR